MISFSPLDFTIVISFFCLLLIIGFLPKKEKDGDSESFLLSNRNVGLLLFIITNVATWYGGILGVGEFTYRYGILSWVTQGLPYYVFAIVFAFLFANKIRSASLYTIPDKLEKVYGKKVGVLSAAIVFVLVSPAPYLLMVGSMLALILKIDLIYGVIIGLFLSGIYLLKGGYKSDLYTDVFQFFIMFGGFIAVVYSAIKNYGGYQFLQSHLPESHLNPTGNVSLVYIVVWFLIALWTFADPGFHQRCYAAKNGTVAKWGIIISVLFFALFDFLTTTTGLYARAILPNLTNPIISFPLFAEKALGSGLKGIFYAAMFATIMSTLNSFLFLSATTIGRDLLYKLSFSKNEKKINHYTRIGLVITSVLSVIIAITVQSVITIWYLIGSICIPPIIILIIGAYYEKYAIEKKYAVIEIAASIIGSVLWILAKDIYQNKYLAEVEPMIIGLFVAIAIHILGLKKKRSIRTAS